MNNEELAKLRDKILAEIAGYENIVASEEKEYGRIPYTYGEIVGYGCARRAVINAFNEHGVK